MLQSVHLVALNKQTEEIAMAQDTWQSVTKLYPWQLAAAKNVMIQQFNGSWVWQEFPTSYL